MTPISEVYNCDCMNYVKGIEDNFFDLVIADPPYRDMNENAPQKEMREHGDISKFGDKPTQDVIKEFQRVGKHQIIFGANNFGYAFKGFLAWDKSVRGSDRYSQVEIASIDEKLSTVSRLCQISCYDASGKIHPTQKPIELYGWILDNYATKIKSGGGKIKVFDPMMGSGSSRIACYIKGYDFYGCEINEEYYKLAEERFRKECFGEYKLLNGRTIQQLTLF